MNRPLIRYIRLILLPLSWLYGLIIHARHFLYDKGIFASTRSQTPVVVIGNLEVGGTGKTPMTEHLIRLWKDRKRIAVLSRGYGRQTRGYRDVHADSSAELVGDEPLQIKQKFPELSVAVCEDRVRGTQVLQAAHDIILLDDAFQHRALQAHCNILLFNYATLDWRFLLPAGNYRDVFSARKRAHILIVTKCPPDLGDMEKEAIQQKLAPLGQPRPLLFASIAYGALTPAFNGQTTPVHESELHRYHILLVTGIARPQPLLDRMQERAAGVVHLAYPDHHRFSDKDLQDIQGRYRDLPGAHKVIITTEKDAKRLTKLPADLPLYYLPITHQFHGDGAQQLEEALTDLLSQQRPKGKS